MEILVILLIISLVIGIVFDAIRIRQYATYRKSLDKSFRELTIRRINTAYWQYHENDTSVTFGEYLIDYMEECK